ncbi:Inherit from bactNOG: outer membrane autotransporter barrel [Seminavis robusta]|uniref:Inherit from bactNOG: outer membrane autotransporter barrel n=1 Tax=Seminavis robusta TaxID=568900 RepID=A0A9N8HHB9_9STRA|nr:Inherit from bactNOG: outer membrane autotransporter barrel [Seminavis robusta]|eukprot:Sro554_g165500.1 Inherit from bactNOG: outer membrane autotransporter barrel (552) ;mRNA; f:21307-23063
MGFESFLTRRLLLATLWLFRSALAHRKDEPILSVRGKRQRRLSEEKYAWIQIGDSIIGEAVDDNSGHSVAINRVGDSVAVGARVADGPIEDTVNAGHVRVFVEDANGAWIQKGSDIDGEAEADRSGYEVAMNANGNILGISARFNDNSNGQDSGHVRVFIYDSTITQDWVQMGQDLDGAGTSEWLESVALSEDGLRVAIGASRHPLGSFHGEVQVFDYDFTSELWVQAGQDLGGLNVGDRFGGTIALSDSGGFLAVGGYGADCSDDINDNCGHAEVFEYITADDEWVQMGSTLYGGDKSDYFGTDLALSGDGTILAVGAKRHLSFTGKVQVFRFDSTTSDWVTMGQHIVGEATNDLSGTALSLSTDGTKLAIGAWSNDSPFGTNSGHVRVFEYLSAADRWEQVGADIDGKDSTDGFGWSVAMNGDGSRIVAGAPDRPGEDDSYKGAVRVFEYAKVTEAPSVSPTTAPSAAPSNSPSVQPSRTPSLKPTNPPIPALPTVLRVQETTVMPSPMPSQVPLEECWVNIGRFFTDVTEWIVGLQAAVSDDFGKLGV